MFYPEIFSSEETLFEISLVSHDYINLHRHNFIEFIYVIEGYGIEEVNGVCHPLKRGVLSMILPYQYHKIWQDEHRMLRYYSVAMSMDYLMQSNNMSKIYIETFKMLDINQAPMIFQQESFLSIEETLNTMLEEFRNRKKWWQEVVKSSLVTLFIAINRELSTLVQGEKPIKIQMDKEYTIWKIMQYVYCHFDENISLKQLSYMFSMNSTYISSRVKEVTGQNYYDFLTDIRLKHAQSLIKTTDMKMTEIAQVSGYQSYRSFARAYANKLLKYQVKEEVQVE